jgi:hypothetical protein
MVGQGVVINEFMSSNSETIDVEDGDFSDWIEIYNRSNSVINLDTTNTGQGFLSDLEFSHEAGFYSGSFQLTIGSTDPVYYTLDGSVPTLTSTLVTGPIVFAVNPENILSTIPTTHLPYANEWPNAEFGFQEPATNQDKAVVLRAQSYSNGEPSSKVYTRTFFISNNQYSYPVFSLITDSLSLFDYDTGLFVPGVSLDSGNLNWSGNYFGDGKDWERDCHIEMFDNGTLKVSDDVGFRITGNGSRVMPQKSVKLYWRNEYGNSSVTYPFFKNRAYSEYKRLTLRSSFTYWYWSGGNNTLFQDDILHRIIADSDADLETQSSRPSILFINGEYWGIQNMRETHGNHYLSNLYGFDRDSIDIIDGNNLSAEEGSAEDFESLFEFIRTNDLTDAANYDHVKKKIDLPNYIDYFIMETYFGNRDWPINNVRIWKPQRTDAKWRWLLFDLDGCVPEDEHDSFAFRADSAQTQATIFNKLIQNDSFKEAFINRYIHHFNTTFSPSRITSVINDFRNMYSKEIQGHIDRWNNPRTIGDWQSSCKVFQNFVVRRPCLMKEKLANEFNLTGRFWEDCRQIDSDFEIEVFPNPSDGIFTIRIDHPILLNGTLSVTNVHGQLLYTSKLDNLLQTIDLSQFRNGVYFIRAAKDGIAKTTKIIIQR